MRSISETTKILHALYQNEDDVLQPCLKKMKLKKRELTKDDAKVKKHKEMVPSDGEELADHADVTLYDDNITWCESRPCEDEIMGTEITKSENKVTERKVTKDNDKVLKIGVINDEDEIGGVREFPSPSIFAQSFQTIGTPRSEEICDNPVDTCNPKDSEKSNAYLNEKETWKVKSRDKKKHGCMMNVNNLMKHLSKDEPSYMVDYHSSFTRSTA
ncbi:uncharacterized protein [Venturia canescens]|uniref:uncharacterized protein isoform X3 n=1 Tax=Venturia canescens TaxID=32260 RepID=UPI001C9CD3DC|nr:uncharacterized protein LOC122410621 isoform X3 [Venturia canescens]